MPAANKHPSWWNPNGRHKHTVNNTFEKISNSKPSVRSRRLTSFHRSSKHEGQQIEERNESPFAKNHLTFGIVPPIIKSTGDACCYQTPPVVETQRSPQTEKNLSRRRMNLQTISRLSAADGLLLILIVQIEHERNDARQRANGSKSDQNRRSYMYHLPRFNPRE